MNPCTYWMQNCEQWLKQNNGPWQKQIPFFARALHSAIVKNNIDRVIEYGAGDGRNLLAIKSVIGGVRLYGIDCNQTAVECMKERGIFAWKDDVLRIPITPRGEDAGFDIVLTKGFLMHVPPEDLEFVYRKIYNASWKYILLCEYYSPTPEEIPFCGERGILWRRDFAGDMMRIFPDLQLIDYGFAYHRDEAVEQNDITWFLLQK